MLPYLKIGYFLVIKIKYLIYIFTVSAVIYGVHFLFLPIDLYRLSYVILSALFLFHLKYIFMPKQWLWLILLVCISMLYSLFVSFYTFSFEFHFVRMHVDYLLTFIVFIPIFVLYVSRGNTDIVSLLIYIISTQEILMFLMLALPDFQKFILSLLDINGIKRSEGLFRFRGVGFTGLATYSMAVSQSFGLYLFHIYWLRNLSKKKFYFSLFLFLIIFLSALLSARTSFIFIGLLLLSYVFVFMTSTNIYLKRRILKALLFITTMTILTGLYLANLDLPEINKMLDWLGEFFYNLISGEGFKTSSTEKMKTFFFTPDELTILLGDGRFLSASEGYYMSIDIGYLRVLLYGGLIGSLLFYAVFIYLFFILIKTLSKKFGYASSIPMFFYAIAIFLTNIKGAVFFDGFLAMKFVSILAFALLYKDRSKKWQQNVVQKL